MRPLGALLVTVVMCGVCVSSAAAQIMSGQPNRPRDRSGNWNAPTLPLDTDVATRRPTFRASVTRVEVSALVVDAAGRPVRDLGPDEVQIYDGGKRQKVRTFTAVSRASNPVPMDTLSPADAAAAARETNAWAGTSRLIALVIDDLHIDPRHAERARIAARRLVDELAPSDLLLVGLTSSPAESTAAFTRDRRRALDIIGRFGGLRLPDESREMRQGHSLGASSPGLAASEQQRSMRLVDAYEAIQRIGVAARSVPGRRKTLVFLSEGSTGATSAAASTALTAEATGAMMNAVAAATVGDVAVYPIDPSGLGTPTDRLVEGFTRAVDDTGREIAHVDLSNLIAGFLQARNQLGDLAALTGGVSLVDRNDLDGAIARVLGDASDYYVISYEPDRAVKGTKVRTVEVRVSRPGVRVHARRGYLAPPATPPDMKADDDGLSPDMTALLGGVVPEDGVPMLVRVLPIAHAGQRVRHAVVVDAAGGVLMGALHRGQVSFEQAVADVDGAGRIGMVTHRTATFKAKTSQAGQLGQDWVRTIWAIDLSPGEHQVRVATSLAATGVRGSMYVDVRVAPGQALETAALASVVSDAKPTVFIDPVLQDVMAPPALARTRELDADVRGARVERDVTMTHAPPEWLAIPKDGRLAASDGLDLRPLQNAGVSFENASLGMLVGALRNVGSCADDVRVCGFSTPTSTGNRWANRSRTRLASPSSSRTGCCRTDSASDAGLTSRGRQPAMCCRSYAAAGTSAATLAAPNLSQRWIDARARLAPSRSISPEGRQPTRRRRIG